MRTGYLPHLGLVAALALLVWLGLLQLSTPAAAPLTAPVHEFSAARAMEHLQVVATEPRPIGSPGNLATLAYLTEQVEALGLQPEVQTTSVVAGSEGGPGFGAGTVNNLIVRVPGTNSTGAVAINAHFDGGSTGPAASDAGSGVVTALETLRAVIAGDALRNDLVVIFADGEENGMLGSAAFNEQHPWAADVKLAINYEAQGSGGPAMLYTTSKDNGWLVEQYLDVVPNASAYSFLPEISWLVPSARLDCDLGEFTEEGIHGLGLVYAADTPAYHTILDNTDRIDTGSIQQEGDATLALVRHFGDLDLNDMPRTSNRVFFNVLPGVVVNYSYDLVLPLAALVTLLVAGVAAYGVRRGSLSVRGIIAGTAGSFGATIAAVAVSGITWFVVRTLNTDYQVFLIGTYQTMLYLVALSALSVAVVAGIYALLRRRVCLLDLAAGVLAGGTLVLWFTSITVPGISYIVAWPLLFGILPVAWRLIPGRFDANAWLRAGVLAVAAIPVFLILPGTLYQVVGLVNRFEGIMGMPLLGVTTLFIAPLAGLFLLHIDMLEEMIGDRRWVVPAVAAAVAIALIGWGNLTSGFDAGQPRPNQIAYQLDADRGEALWISYDRNLDGWTSQFFPDDARRANPDSLFFEGFTGYVAPAPLVDIPVPEVTLLSDTTDGGLRTLVLNLAATGTAAHTQMVRVTAEGAIAGAAINEHQLDVANDSAAPDGELTVAYNNVPDGGWTLTVTVQATGPVTVEVDDATLGLPDVPGMTIEPRPPDTMPAPGLYDPAIVKRAFTY